jgi:hypothetical protein
MSQSVYIEDVFVEFYSHLLFSTVNVDAQDAEPIENFYQLCQNNRPLTEKQANFIIRLLKKYKSKVSTAKFDYTTQLETIKFKNPFRVIDSSRRVYIIQEEKGVSFLCLQFPYSFKETFDKEFGSFYQNFIFAWDEKRYVRKAELFKVNFLQIYSFVTEYGFDIDESFQKLIFDLEHALENQENIIPYSSIEQGTVNLKLASDSVLENFNKNKPTDINEQMFLAKTMGYPVRLLKKPGNFIEKISSTSSNTFWLKEISDIFEIYKTLKLKIAVIVDRAQDSISWLSEFIEKSEISGVAREKIKVCFRDSKINDTGLNQWIKDNSVGGKLDGGDILIFQHSPPKWLFKEENYAKIVVTTMITPSTSQITSDYLDTHPCVIYLSGIRPTLKGKKQIVEL